MWAKFAPFLVSMFFCFVQCYPAYAGGEFWRTLHLIWPVRWPVEKDRGHSVFVYVCVGAFVFLAYFRGDNFIFRYMVMSYKS